MRTKKVNRYWCDFCNRAGLSAGHMRSHEKHCTMNPNRECRVCKMVADDRDADFVMPPLSALVAILPDPLPFKRVYEGITGHGYFDESLVGDVGTVLSTLRAAAGGCPACILAAIRQRGIPVPMVEKFSFTDEMKEIWNGINKDNAYERY